MGGPPHVLAVNHSSTRTTIPNDVTFCGVRLQYPSTHLSSVGNCKIPIKPSLKNKTVRQN